MMYHVNVRIAGDAVDK